MIAIPLDSAEELFEACLVSEIPAVRGLALEAVVSVAVNSSVTLVTLMQAPESIRSFSAWVVNRSHRSSETIRISGRRNGRAIDLEVNGDVPIEAVTEFLRAALESGPSARSANRTTSSRVARIRQAFAIGRRNI
ncbi:MAG TPA: hypothetical protein DCQ04_06540 [Actinobacteria bacterium]|nr:hypothetical protein [Actinomycetota bacterium]